MDNETTKLLQLGRKIYAIRREKGFSQNQLAEKLEISREHLAKIETAKRCVSLMLLFKISKILNIPLKEFFYF